MYHRMIAALNSSAVKNVTASEMDRRTLRGPLQAGEATSLGPLGQEERNLPTSKGLRHGGPHDSAPCGRKVVGCAKTNLRRFP